MSNSELFQALKMFQEGAEKYAISSAIQESQQAASDINVAETDEFKRRAALQMQSQNLASHLASFGAPTSQIQMAAGAIAPPVLNSPDDFFSQAQTAQSPEAQKQLLQAGHNFQKYLADSPLTTSQKEQMKLGWAQLFGQQQTAQAGLDLQKSVKNQEDLDKVDEAQYRHNSLQQNALKLRGLVDQSGTNVLVGSEGAQMDSLIYQMAVDYAKLIDPTSVAREGEVEAAKKFMLPIREYAGLGYSNDTAKSLIDNYLQGLDERMTARKGAQAGVKLGLSQLNPKDAMMLEGQNRLKKYILRDPNDPKIEVMQRALDNAAKGRLNGRQKR